MALSNRLIQYVTMECISCGKTYTTDHPYGNEQEGQQYRRFCTEQEETTTFVCKEVKEV